MRINYLYPLSHLRAKNLYPLYHLTSRVFNKVLSLPSDINCKVHSTDWFERSVLLPQYQQQLSQHKEQLPQLDLNDRAIVKQLEQEAGQPHENFGIVDW